MFLFLSGVLAGAAIVIVAVGTALAILVRHEGKSYDREQIALAEANGAFHRGSL